MAERSKVSQRILEIDQCFGLTGQALAVPGRVLIAEGVLTKSCRTGIKPRQFFLFNDILVYGSILVKNVQFAKQHIIPLQVRVTSVYANMIVCVKDVSVRMLGDGEGEVDHGWVVNTRSKSFTVYAATRGEKMGWIDAINKASSMILSRSGKTVCQDFAPVMTPNSSVSACMSCHQEFSLMVRRHHCKRCGRVCCRSCAPHKLLLPSRPGKQLRVCLSCFAVLSKLREERRKNMQASKLDQVEKTQTTGEESNQVSNEKESTVTEQNAKPLNPSHYRLAEAGLWWDSFEEDPVFDITQEFDDQLTLSEGIILDIHPDSDCEMLSGVCLETSFCFDTVYDEDGGSDDTQQTDDDKADQTHSSYK